MDDRQTHIVGAYWPGRSQGCLAVATPAKWCDRPERRLAYLEHSPAQFPITRAQTALFPLVFPADRHAQGFRVWLFS